VPIFSATILGVYFSFEPSGEFCAKFFLNQRLREVGLGKQRFSRSIGPVFPQFFFLLTFDSLFFSAHHSGVPHKNAYVGIHGVRFLFPPLLIMANDSANLSDFFFPRFLL